VLKTGKARKARKILVGACETWLTSNELLLFGTRWPSFNEQTDGCLSIPPDIFHEAAQKKVYKNSSKK